MNIVFYQQLSLYMSLLTILSMLLLSITRKKARLFYFSMMLGWLPGLIYYISVLYFYNDFLNYYKIPAIDVSAMLRTYQYFMFGAWFIFDALYTLCEFFKEMVLYKKLFNSISTLQKKMRREKDG